MNEVYFRKANKHDCLVLSKLEESCFPANEAASLESLIGRLEVYPDHFLLMQDGDNVIGMINGMCSNERDRHDVMYADASMHDEKGSWQMVFGVNTIPSYRRKGYAGELIRRAIEDARAQGRKGLVLTCKDRLIPYYSKFGFVLEGVSESVHGNVVWNQMRLTFPA